LKGYIVGFLAENPVHLSERARGRRGRENEVARSKTFRTLRDVAEKPPGVEEESDEWSFRSRIPWTTLSP